MSYKAAIKVTGETGLSYNALRFATPEEATAYAKNLFSRWMLMTGFEVETSEDAVNYVWGNNGLTAVTATNPPISI
jgi:hypothetical protein